MAELSHSSKRKINRVATFPNRINNVLDQEFVDTRRRLAHISDSLNTLKRDITTTRQTWNTVVRQQRDFTSRLSASFPQAGDVSAHAREVEVAMRDVQRQMILSDGDASPHYRIMEVIDRYQELLRGIESQYRPIEVLCTEKMRYERKVDSLEKRTGFRKNPDRLQRNLEKLADAQNALDTKVNASIRRMRAAFQKHDAVLQCAHHAFWMANNTYLATIEDATRDVRVESVNVHKLLMDIEMDDEKQLMPIPRTHLIQGTGMSSVGESQNEERTTETLVPSSINTTPRTSDVKRIPVGTAATRQRLMPGPGSLATPTEDTSKKVDDEVAVIKYAEEVKRNTVVTSESESESETSDSVDRISFEGQDSPLKRPPALPPRPTTPAVISTKDGTISSQNAMVIA